MKGKFIHKFWTEQSINTHFVYTWIYSNYNIVKVNHMTVRTRSIVSNTDFDLGDLHEMETNKIYL